MKNKQKLIRRQEPAKAGDKELGSLKLLPGTWRGNGTGWNMIALPFGGAPGKYRILMNQYNETLAFTTVSDNVENRGLADILEHSDNPPLNGNVVDDDQFVVALDYQQSIEQTHAEDFPDSGGLAGSADKPIHHEPGLFLFMKNQRAIDKDVQFNAVAGALEVTNSVLQVARLATIPHGNSVLALGTANEESGEPNIPPLSGLPIGRFEDLGEAIAPKANVFTDPYLAPYKHYIEAPFMGGVDVAQVPGFPGFNPKEMNEILRFANRGVDIKRTTVLTMDTTRQRGGVLNAPFTTAQAEPVSMKSTFWIQELAKKEGTDGPPKLRLQYSQVVMLDFFLPRQDGLPNRVRWPHVSINTLEKVHG